MGRSKAIQDRGSREGYPGGDKENEDEDIDIEVDEEYERHSLHAEIFITAGDGSIDERTLFPPSTSIPSFYDCTILAKTASSTRLLDLLARLRLSCSLAHWRAAHQERARGLQNPLEQKMATTEMVRDGLCGCRRQSRTQIQRTRKAGELTFFHTCVQCEAQRKTLVGVLFIHWKVEMGVEKCLPLGVAVSGRKVETNKQAYLVVSLSFFICLFTESPDVLIMSSRRVSVVEVGERMIRPDPCRTARFSHAPLKVPVAIKYTAPSCCHRLFGPPIE